MTYKYDPKSGRLLAALSLANTVVPSVLSSIDFWLFFILHLAVFISFRAGWLSGETGVGSFLSLDWSFVKVVTAMTTFFEVFYANQCYARYVGLYRSMNAVINNAYEFTYMLRVYSGETARNHLRVSVRYMSAALLLHFYEVKGLSISREEWAELRIREVLKPSEIEALAAHKGHHRAMVALSWSATAARLACEQNNAPNNATGLLMQVLMKVRTQQQEIRNTLALPVPFQYFHLLSVMIITNLALWAYSMGLTDSMFAPLVFFCASLILIGIMELSSELSDPFGADEVDFPVHTWLEECLELISELVEHEYPGGIGGLEMAITQEQLMRRGTQDLGFISTTQHFGGHRRFLQPRLILPDSVRNESRTAAPDSSRRSRERFSSRSTTASSCALVEEPALPYRVLLGSQGQLEKKPTEQAETTPRSLESPGGPEFRAILLRREEDDVAHPPAREARLSRDSCSGAGPQQGAVLQCMGWRRRA